MRDNLRESRIDIPRFKIVELVCSMCENIEVCKEILASSNEVTEWNTRDRRKNGACNHVPLSKICGIDCNSHSQSSSLIGALLCQLNKPYHRACVFRPHRHFRVAWDSFYELGVQGFVRLWMYGWMPFWDQITVFFDGRQSPCRRLLQLVLENRSEL